MDRETERYLDRWWANLFGVPVEHLWRSVTVLPHTALDGYAGWFAAHRADGAHVSAPSGAPAEVVSRLAASTANLLTGSDFWARFADDVGGRLVGPSRHLYLDADPGPDPGVVAVDPQELEGLRDLVDPAEWEESGLGDEEVSHGFAWYEGGRLLAASALSDFDDRPRDVCVLVAPKARGRRLADRVARTAASYAVREHRVARWTARETNQASLAVADRLGFETWCTQLAVRAG